MNEKDQTIRLPETWAADWILDRRLGSGAFSTVYRAVRRDRPGVEAAIKVISIPANEAEAAALRAEGMNESQSQSFFDAVAREYISEIDLMEDLKGTPNIVSIEDYKVVRKPDGIGNNIFIRMELLKPLDTVLRERTLTEQEVVRLGIDHVPGIVAFPVPEETVDIVDSLVAVGPVLGEQGTDRLVTVGETGDGGGVVAVDRLVRFAHGRVLSFVRR